MRQYSVLLCLTLAACAPHTRVVREPSVAEPSHYTAIAGRDLQSMQHLRAAPPPSQADMREGKTFDADRDALTLQSYVLVGISDFDPADGDFREQALKQAGRIGADRIMLYPARPTIDTTATAPNRVAYYIRLSLPFGATFRDLNPTERKRYGDAGVRLGEIVGDSPASRANLLPGDIVLAVNGQAVSQRADFQAALSDNLGKIVILRIRRNADTLERRVQLGVVATR